MITLKSIDNMFSFQSLLSMQLCYSHVAMVTVGMVTVEMVNVEMRLFSGELLHDIKLPNKPALWDAVCAGPGHTLMVAGRTPVCVWVYGGDGQLRQTVCEQELGVEEGHCYGIGVTNDLMVVTTCNRVHSYRLTH